MTRLFHVSNVTTFRKIGLFTTRAQKLLTLMVGFLLFVIFPQFRECFPTVWPWTTKRKKENNSLVWVFLAKIFHHFFSFVLVGIQEFHRFHGWLWETVVYYIMIVTLVCVSVFVVVVVVVAIIIHPTHVVLKV